MSAFELTPRGPFSLAAAARFIGGWEPATGTGDAAGAEVRLAFLADDWSGHAGVVLRQAEDGTVRGELVPATTAADRDAVIAQAARVVSLDHDGTGYAALGERDPVIGDAQRATGFVRPVLFHSPYEAACWAIISARLRQPQARRVRDALAAAHGAVLEVDGERLPGFPAPEALLALADVPGLTGEKVERLHGIARAALDGRLDRAALLAAEPEAALAGLRELRGIGPFWAEAILLRAVGTTDVAPTAEARVRAVAARRYGRPEVEADDAAWRALSEGWRPFRTWASVLLRVAG